MATSQTALYTGFLCIGPMQSVGTQIFHIILHVGLINPDSQICGVFPYIYHKAYFTQLAFESLAETRVEDDTFLHAQALQTLASKFLAFRYPLWAKHLLERAFAAVYKYDIRFMPRQEAQLIPTFSEEIHERAMCLSQLIYAQICLDLLYESSNILVELENQMEDELAVCALN